MDSMMRFSAVLLLSCGAPDTRVLFLEPQCCACPPDATVDAPVDAPDGIDLAQPWTRTVLVAGTATLRGADGVADDAQGCWWTPWEQSASGEWRVTRVCGAVVQGWSDSSLSGSEDVKPGDFDNDGAPDGAVAVALQSNAAVRLVFSDMTQAITLSASQGLGPVLQLAVSDVDGDGDDDVVFGTQKTSSAAGRIAWLENPGTGLARLGIHWTRHDISLAGWPMSVLARDMDGDGDMDVVVSDRAKLGTSDWSLYGARWHENPNWTLHTITGGAPTSPATPYQTGSCSPYASATCERTPGDEMMLDVVPFAFGGHMIVEGQSAGSQPDSRILIHYTASSLHVFVPPATAVGHYQHAIAYDVDEDGDLDLVVSTWIADSLAGADRTKSWLYWLRNNGDGTWSRGEISGPGQGVKGDNVAQSGRCVVTSEQVDNRGVELWCPSGASLP